jgi:hypothetical protein
MFLLLLVLLRAVIEIKSFGVSQFALLFCGWLCECLLAP